MQCPLSPTAPLGTIWSTEEVGVAVVKDLVENNSFLSRLFTEICRTGRVEGLKQS